MVVELLLSESLWSDDEEEEDDGEKVISILKKLETIIWSVITASGRAESRLWLCNTISSLSSITPRVQHDLFLNLLRSKPSKVVLATQVLQMIFEKRPYRIGPILAKKSDMLENFFDGNPRRILQWFDHFAGIGESEHRKGARAISQFAFVNRDICWEELEWKGKHGQSPAVVATKPHYFLDLDVQRTVENFLESVPEFWSSVELAESLKDGEILHIDTTFFVDYFVRLMYEENSKEVWDVISEFLMEEPFPLLCNRILILLEEQDLFVFLSSVRKFSTLKMESKCFDHPSYWLEILLFTSDGFTSIDELLLLNAVINQGRQLLRLVRDEEHQEQKKEIENLVLEFRMTSSISGAPFINECFKTKKSEVMKLLGLHSWVLQYRMSEECVTPESWETLFNKNAISFRKSDSHDLLRSDEVSESGFDFDDEGSVRTKRRKKGKVRKKKRRNYGRHSSDDNEDSDMSSVRQGLQSRDRSWLLSTDDYSSSWNSLDLPEHLAKHCFCKWMKLIVIGSKHDPKLQYRSPVWLYHAPLPHLLWSLKFLKMQGFDEPCIIVDEDTPDSVMGQADKCARVFHRKVFVV